MKLLDSIKKYHHLIWDEHETSAVYDIFHEDAKIHSPLKSVIGASELKSILDGWLKAFPDLKVHWDQLLSSDEKVVARWHAIGTHKDTFLDIPATNNKINYQGVTLYEFESDKVKEYWGIIDMDDIKRQLAPK